MGTLFGSKNVFGSQKGENLFVRMQRQEQEKKVNKIVQEAKSLGLDPNLYYSIISTPEYRYWLSTALRTKNIGWVSFRGKVGFSGEWKRGMIYVYDSQGKLITKLRVKEGTIVGADNYLAVLSAVNPQAYNELVDTINKTQQSQIEGSVRTQQRFREAKLTLEEAKRKGLKLTPEQERRALSNISKFGSVYTASEEALVGSGAKVEYRPPTLKDVEERLVNKGFKIRQKYKDDKGNDILISEFQGVKVKVIFDKNTGNIEVKPFEEEVVTREVLMKLREKGFKVDEYKKDIDPVSEARKSVLYSAVLFPRYLLSSFFGVMFTSIPTADPGMSKEEFEFAKNYYETTVKMPDLVYKANKKLINEKLNYINEEIKKNFGEKASKKFEILSKGVEYYFEVPNIIVSYFGFGAIPVISSFAQVPISTRAYIGNIKSELLGEKVDKRFKKDVEQSLIQSSSDVILNLALYKGSKLIKYVGSALEIYAPKLTKTLSKFGKTTFGTVIKQGAVPATIAGMTFLSGEKPDKALKYGLAAGLVETAINLRTKRVKARMAVENVFGRRSFEIMPTVGKDISEVRGAQKLMRSILTLEKRIKPGSKKTEIDIKEMIKLEEDNLKNIFGKEYKNYFQKAKKYYPNPYIERFYLTNLEVAKYNKKTKQSLSELSKFIDKSRILFSFKEVTKELPLGFYEGLAGKRPQIYAYLEGDTFVLQKNILKDTLRYKIGENIRKTLIGLRETPRAIVSGVEGAFETFVGKPTLYIYEKLGLGKQIGSYEAITERIELAKKSTSKKYKKQNTKKVEKFDESVIEWAKREPKKEFLGIEKSLKALEKYEKRRKKIKESDDIVKKQSELIEQIEEPEIIEPKIEYTRIKPKTKITKKITIKTNIKTIKKFAPKKLTQKQKTEIKATTKVTPKPIIKTQVKPSIKTGTKSVIKAVVKPIIKTQVKPIIKTQIKSIQKTQIKPVVKTQVKTTQKTIQKAIVKSTLKAIPKSIIGRGIKKRVRKRKRKVVSSSMKDIQRDITNIILGVGGASFRGILARGEVRKKQRKRKKQKLDRKKLARYRRQKIKYIKEYLKYQMEKSKVKANGSNG